MKFILTILSCVLLSPMWGQYAYYNEYLPFVQGDGFSLPLYTNILPESNDLYLFGLNYSGNYNTSISKVNSLGQFYDTLLRPLAAGDFMAIEGEESIISLNNGFIWSGGAYSTSLPKLHAEIIKYDTDFNVEWKYDYPFAQQESVNASQYIGIRENPDGTYLAAGYIQYDSVLVNSQWTEAADLLLTKISADGDIIWNQVYQITRDELFPVSQPLFFLRDVIVLDTGEIYVWGLLYDQRDPFVIRFNQNGLFLDHLIWGSATFQDGVPYPVLIGDHQFAVAYNNGISGDELNYQQQIRIGILDGILMQFHWLVTYDYVQLTDGISDFERTSDNGYVVFGNGVTPSGFGPAYLLKIDDVGDVQWFWQYMPTTTCTSMFTYDMDALSDGGVAFVGYAYLDHQYYAPWLVRTNACGELINNGCVINGVLEEQSSTEQAFTPYPNPTSGICNLKGLQDVSSIEVICAMGQLVLKTNVANGQGQVALDLASFSAGIYTIRLINEAGLTSGQFPIIKE
jgi:Secretion system C-terminal sorting domain